MRQVKNYGDARQLARCVYCALGSTATRDHVPSKVLLDEPFPENLPVVPACPTCNASFSADEEYVACLLECVLSGSASKDEVCRPKIRRILGERPALAAMLEKARRNESEKTWFTVDQSRVRTVLMKLARGHAAFELNDPRFEEPSVYWAAPLELLSEAERSKFEGQAGELAIWPEVGSRAMMRLLEGQDLGPNGWITVQPGRYRYTAMVADGIVVRIVLSEYLACEVIWDC